MKLYSYILTYDGGTTPNPFHNICTLAICKPAIRRTAQLGDWIIATGPTRSPTHRKLIFAIKVDEIIPLEKYFLDPRFQIKKPDPASPDPQRRMGDNLYSLSRSGDWSQLPGPRRPDLIAKDISGENALLARHFFYFGSNAIALTSALQKLIHANQGHRCHFPDELIQHFITWLETHHSPGFHGQPSDPPPPQILEDHFLKGGGGPSTSEVSRRAATAVRSRA